MKLTLTLLLSSCVYVCQVLGTPSEDTWPGVHTLPHFKPGETFFFVVVIIV